MSTHHAASPHPRSLEGGVVLLGAGRLGIHLAILIGRAGVRPVYLWNRRSLGEHRSALLRRWSHGTLPIEVSTGALPKEALRRAALTLLVVSDSALEPLAGRLAREVGQVSCPVLHCSGAFSGGILEPLARTGTPVGSLHPLRSFALDSPIQDLSDTWFAIEGTEASVTAARSLVTRLGGTPVVMRSESKTAYHAAAVMASNLVVALVSLATDLLAPELDSSVSKDDVLKMLLSLVKGTVENLEQVGLPGALTGPISRGDRVTVARHLEMLSSRHRDDSPTGEGAETSAGEHNRPGVGVRDGDSRKKATNSKHCIEGTDPAVVYRALSLQAVALAARQGLPETTCDTLRALLLKD